MGHFFGLSYRKYRRVVRAKKVFFRIGNILVPCQHAQHRGRTGIKKLRTFFGHWDRDRSQSPPCWIFRVKQIHPSTASERTTRQQCSVLFTHYPWSLVLSINVPFPIPFGANSTAAISALKTNRTHAISVLPGPHLHLSQVKHIRVKCLPQGHDIETMSQC